MRTIITTMLLLLCLSASAQKDTAFVIQGPFYLSGPMTYYLDTDNLDDVKVAEDGCKWHLKKDSPEDGGKIQFWIDTPEIEGLNFTTWTDSAILFLRTEGMNTYSVYNYDFRHLSIVNFEKGKYLVKHSSEYHPLPGPKKQYGPIPQGEQKCPPFFVG